MSFLRIFHIIFVMERRSIQEETINFKLFLLICQSSLSVKIVSNAHNLTIFKAKAFILKDERMQR